MKTACVRIEAPSALEDAVVNFLFELGCSGTRVEGYFPCSEAEVEVGSVQEVQWDDIWKSRFPPHPRGEVVALEADPEAVRSARENVGRNGVGSQVKVVLGSLGEGPGGPFQLVLANLLLRVLPPLKEFTSPGARAIFYSEGRPTRLPRSFGGGRISALVGRG